MGILCKIMYNEDGSIQAIEAPNGNESKLFKDLKQLDLNDQEALDAWTVSNTDSFKDEILVPRINKAKTRIVNQLKNLTPKATTIRLALPNYSPTPVADDTNKERIDVDKVRTQDRSGSKVSKGLIVKNTKGVITKTETPSLSRDYVREVAPATYVKNANIIRGYPIIKDNTRKVNSVAAADKVYEEFVQRTADNLVYLTEEFNQDFKDVASLWYDGANKMAQDLSDKYDVSIEQVSGIIASLSPQKDWYQNVKMADLVLDVFKRNPSLSAEMISFQEEINNRGLKLAQKRGASAAAKVKANSKAVIDLLKQYEGQSLSEVPASIKPYIVRLDNEVSGSKDYEVVRPDGIAVGIAKKKDGNNQKLAWGSYAEIGKAVSIYTDGSQSNISETLGTMHKVRNFYNNIVDPMSVEGDVTIDTHAVAAALLQPLSGNSPEVGQNFGTNAASSGVTGVKGLYFAYSDAYGIAAERLGLLPRQIQSITWEASRGLFTDQFKANKKNVTANREIWNDYKNGKIDIDETRNRIKEAAKGIEDPTWAGFVLPESGAIDGQTTDTAGIPRNAGGDIGARTGRRANRDGAGAVRVLDNGVAEINITKLRFPSVTTDAGVTVFAAVDINGEEQRLGRIRLKKFRDGYQIDSSLLNDLQVEVDGNLESIKGKGLGTQLYKRVIQTLTGKGFPLYSDKQASPAAEGVWKKLINLGIVRTETVKGGRYYVIDPTPSSLDSNKEPSANDVLSYIANSNNSNIAPLTENEIVDLGEALLNTDMNNSDELIQEFDKMFFENGGFEVTKAGLAKSKVYTKAEQENILNSPELQAQLQDVYFKMKASPSVANDLFVDRDFITINSTEPNIIGKFTSANPFIMEKAALQQLAGAKTREEFESNLLESDLEYLKESYYKNLNTPSDIYFSMSNFSNVPVKTIKNGELVDKMSNSVSDLLDETITDPSNTEIIENIVYLSDISTEVWNTNPAEMKTLLKEFSNKAIDIGLDVIGIEDYYDSKTVAEFKDLFNTIDVFMNEQNDDAFNALVESYTNFFGVTELPAVETLRNVEGKAVYLDSKKSAFELFSKFGLLPTGENLYRRVNNERPLDDVYESFYLNIVDNPSILPQKAFEGIAVDKEGVLDRSIISDLNRKGEVIDAMQAFVRAEVVKIDSFGVARDSDMLEKMYLYSAYYNTDINNVKDNPIVSGEISIMENYPSNVKNLIGDYVADFNKEYLREKAKDSQIFKDFYSNFKVTDKGIKMINTDPITMEKMNIELENRKDLKNHLLLQKDSQIRPDELEENFVLEDDTVMRNIYANFPTQLNKFIENYTSVDNDTLLAKTSDNFIRVDSGVYEMVDSYGDYSVFKRISPNTSNYKAYDKNFTKPVNEIDLSSYGISVSNESAEVTINNKYSAAQETNINKEIDNCS